MKVKLTPGGRKWYGPRNLFVRWAYYPYGEWVCANGREVLFNRHYDPIWERKNEGAPAEQANPAEWVEGIVKQTFFYSDGTEEADRRRRGAAVLRAWRIKLPEEPGALLPRHVARRQRHYYD